MAERHTHGRMTRTEQRAAQEQGASGAYDRQQDTEYPTESSLPQEEYDLQEVQPEEPKYVGRRFKAGAQETESNRRESAKHARKEPARATSRSEGAEGYAQRRKRGVGKLVGRVLIVVAAVVAVAAAGVAWYLGDLNNRLSGNVGDDVRGQLVSVEAEDPFYMLLLGVDKDEGRAEAWGDEQANFRSDTIILARVDPKAKKITLVSIPRDTLVDMGEHGEQKINSAYSFGGPAYMIEVVSKFAGVNISHYAEIDFEQFIKIVDTIGGIEVTLPVPVSDMDNAGIDLPAGTQTLDGTQALGLCRSRHAYDAYGGGDFYRAANQRMVIGAILRKVLALDAASMSNAISTMADGVDTDLSVTEILSLAAQFNGLDVDSDVYSGQTPTTSEYINGGWYEIPNTDDWTAMMERVDAGETPYSEASQDFTAGVAGSVSNNGTVVSSNSETETPRYSGSVLVLNSTGTQGLAASNAKRLNDNGFDAMADNATETLQSTAIVYNGDNRDKALGVAATLGVDESQIMKNDGNYSSDVDVVVILGEDQVKDQ